MADKRARASMKKVQEENAPFVKTHIFGRDTVDAKDIQQIVVMLLNQYNNVSIIDKVPKTPFRLPVV